MNLDEKLIEILDKTMSGIDKGTDFLSAEIPEVLSQLLLWYGVYNFILFCTSIIIILISIVGALKYRKYLTTAYADEKVWTRYTPNSNETSSSYDFQTFAAPFIAAIGTFIGLLMLNLQWLKIWIAPKIWLIEYTASLVK